MDKIEQVKNNKVIGTIQKQVNVLLSALCNENEDDYDSTLQNKIDNLKSDELDKLMNEINDSNTRQANQDSKKEHTIDYQDLTPQIQKLVKTPVTCTISFIDFVFVIISI